MLAIRADTLCWRVGSDNSKDLIAVAFLRANDKIGKAYSKQLQQPDDEDTNPVLSMLGLTG